MNFIKRSFKAAKSALFGESAGYSDSDDEYGSDSARGRGGGGYAHKREVVVERPKIPVVQYAVSRYGGEPMGGIQGLWWYAKSLLCDDDGDVACQFLVEPESGRGRGGGGEGSARGDRGVGGEGQIDNEGAGAGSRVGSDGDRYSHALVEVKGVSDGNVVLAPRNLD